LHRRHAKIRENEIHGGESFRGEQLREIREISRARDEHAGAEAGRAQAGFRARQLDRVDVDTDEASAGLQLFQDRLRVPTAAERAVNRDLTGHGSKTAEHFGQHDRAMRGGGTLSGHR